MLDKHHCYKEILSDVLFNYLYRCNLKKKALEHDLNKISSILSKFTTDSDSCLQFDFHSDFGWVFFFRFFFFLVVADLLTRQGDIIILLMSTILLTQWQDKITQKTRHLLQYQSVILTCFLNIKNNLNIWNMEIEINSQENMNIRQVTQQNCALNVILNATDV